MNEWLLVIVVVAVFLLGQLFRRLIKQPMLTYIRVIGCILLMVLVWGFRDNDESVYPWSLTALALFYAVKAIKDYGRHYTNSGSGQEG